MTSMTSMSLVDSYVKHVDGLLASLDGILFGLEDAITNPEDVDRRLELLSRMKDIAVLVDAALAEAAKFDPSNPPADGTCHFLRLPQELRDMIYEYALTEEDCLYYRKDQDEAFGQLYTSQEALHPANQLKNVCRQLNTETKGLSLKFNSEITFLRSNEEPQPMLMCLNFLDTLSPNNLSHIRTLTLQNHGSPRNSDDRMPGTREDLHTLINICANVPTISLNIHIPLLDISAPKTPSHKKHGSFFDPHRVMYWALCLRFAFRDADPTPLLPSPKILTSLRTEGTYWRMGNSVEALNLPNIRFWPQRPGDPTAFDVEGWEKRCRDDSRLRTTVLPRVPGGLHTWTWLIREWHRNGI